MWKVFQPQLYNYHVSGNKILTSMIFATKSLKQQNSKWIITSYCYYQLYCFGLLIIKFFLISTPCNSKFLQIELYWDIIIVLIHFGVHGLWFKSKRLYTREAEPFCLGMRVWDFNCLFPTVQWARDGEDHTHSHRAPSEVRDLGVTHVAGGHVGTRGDTWPLGPVTTSEQSPGLHPRLWTLSLGTAVCCGAEHSAAPKSVL